LLAKSLTTAILKWSVLKLLYE